MSDPPIIPAATLVLMRPGPHAPELLMIERTLEMAFAPGALVFPGGRIDPDDQVLGGDTPGSAKVAAIRETLEETGIAVAIFPQPDEALESQLRAGLASGAPLSRLLSRHHMRLDLEALVPFARWRPNFKETRRFDTMFFLAAAPDDARLPTADETESVHALWTTAQAVLDRADAGDAHIIFPTRRNLERLARFASFEDAAADAREDALDPIVPWMEEREGTRWLCIPEGRGYPVTAQLMADVRRG